MARKKIAVFASGTGSNALNLSAYFEQHADIEVAFILCNKADAPVVAEARKRGLKVELCTNAQVDEPGFLVNLCRSYATDAIILAGFLRKIPQELVEAYPNRIINIHPSLLPKYGGPGMYGNFVHRAVLENKEKCTGISIHFVDPEYDKGELIAQFECELGENESIESIREKIHTLEMLHFPKVVEQAFRSR